MYGYADFDLIIRDTNRNPIDGLSIPMAAQGLASFLRESDKTSERATIVLDSSNIIKDQSRAYQFTSMNGERQNKYYITQWGKILDDNLQFLGRIDKHGKEPDAIPPSVGYKEKQFEDFKYYYPETADLINGLDAEEAAAYVAHKAIPGLFDSPGCKPWTVWFDGTAQINAQKAYIFSANREWTTNLATQNKPGSAITKENAPTAFRMAITADRKAYLLEYTPVEAGILEQLPLPEAQPATPDLINAYKESYRQYMTNPMPYHLAMQNLAKKLPPNSEFIKSFNNSKENTSKDAIGTIILYQNKELQKYTKYPDYRLKMEAVPEDAQMDWVRNAAENVSRWVQTNKPAPYSILYSQSLGEHPFSIVIDNHDGMENSGADRLMVYRGKTKQNGKSCHHFGVGHVRINPFKEAIRYEMDVCDDGFIYERIPSVVFYGDLSQTTITDRSTQEDETNYKHATLEGNGYPSDVCKGRYTLITFNDKVPGISHQTAQKSGDESANDHLPQTEDAAEFLFDHLVQFYQGKRNTNPWFMTAHKKGEINGNKTLEFTVGQSASVLSYPIYFRAYVDERRYFYLKEEKRDVYIERMPDTTEQKKIEMEARQQEIQSLHDLWKREFSILDVDTMNESSYPAPEQNIDMLKAYYKIDSYEAPTFEPPAPKDSFTRPDYPQLETIRYVDFNYAKPIDNEPMFDNLDNWSAAFYINQTVIPSLKIYMTEPWTIRLSGKDRAMGKNAVFYYLGYAEHDMPEDWADLVPKAVVAVTEDKEVYLSKTTYKWIKDMPVQDVPEGGKTENGMTKYPLFTLQQTSQRPHDIDGYTYEQAASEVEASYLHEHNDGHWNIEYIGTTEIEGVRAWQLNVYYLKDNKRELEFEVAVTPKHKLYRPVQKLTQMGTVPDNIEDPLPDITPEPLRNKLYQHVNVINKRRCGIGTVDNPNRIKDGSDVSIKLAANWIFETIAKNYPNKPNNNPLRAVLTGTTIIDNVEAYLFDIGQGKYAIDDTFFQAAVTQDRKIIKITNGKMEPVGSIPDDAPELQ